MTPTMIYVTAGSSEEASRIGRTLVEERIAACANVLPAMMSIYRWQDGVQEDREVVLILKTRRGRVGDLIARVKDLHSYECPCVVALPIAEGNQEFLDWIVEETT